MKKLTAALLSFFAFFFLTGWLFIGQSGPTWRPSDIVGIKGWWGSTSYLDTAGKIDKAVSLLAGGPDANFASTPVDRRPTYSANQLNGKPAWDFTVDGLYASIDSTEDFFTVGTPSAYVFVGQQDAFSGQDSGAVGFFKYGGASNNLSIYYIHDFLGYGDFGVGMGSTTIAITTFDYTTPHYFLVNYNGGTVDDPASYQVYRNNVLQTLTTGGSFGGVPLNTIGNGASSNSFRGNWYELFTVYNNTLDSTARTNLAAYIAFKYGL